MSREEQLEFTVVVDALVEEDQIHYEDHDVPGRYPIYLPADALAWSSSRQVTAVLDEFHSTYAIKVLDDYQIQVYAPNGEEIWEEE